MDQLNNEIDGLTVTVRTKDPKLGHAIQDHRRRCCACLGPRKREVREFLREKLNASVKSERDRELLADRLTEK